MRRINQFERTDRDIANAVLALMEKKSFQKITVQDILDEARINRTTFYKHYSDKYAVLERLQEQYVTELTARIDEALASEESSLEQIGTVLYDYMADHRRQMRMLVSARAEGLDMEEQLRLLFVKYFDRSGAGLSDLEADLLSSMLVRFVIYFLKTDMDAKTFAATMLDSWLDMSVFFFRISDVPDAKKRILNLLGSMHSS